MITKILVVATNKKVKYFGYEFEIPISFNFMTIDKDGAIFAFVEQPHRDISFWTCAQSLPLLYVATVEYNGDWTESLQQV